MSTPRRSCAMLLLAIALPASGQTPARLDLVRCAVASDAACFQTVGTPGAPRQVVAVGPDGVVGLGRVSLKRRLVERIGSDSAITLAWWRPPLIAMPAFRGVSDSSLLAPGVREALIVGTISGSDRPVIALLLATLLGFTWLAVRRLGWDDIEMAAKREREATTRTTRTGSPDDEAPPRSPDDVTRQTARRTALRR